MEVRLMGLMLMCSVILLSLSLVMCDKTDLHEKKEADDKEQDVSSASSNNLQYRSNVHFRRMKPTTERDDYAENESSKLMFYNKGTARLSTSDDWNEDFDLKTDCVKCIDTKIDSLMNSNERIESMLSGLDKKFDMKFDFMNSLAALHNLNKLDKLCEDMTSQAKESLDPNEIQIIRNFIANENNNLNVVVENSCKIIQDLQGVAKIVKRVDERTNRLYVRDRSHKTDLPDCNSNIERRSENENTYRNLRRDTTYRVNYAPKKSSCDEIEEQRDGIYHFGSVNEASNEAGRFFNERYCEFDLKDTSGGWTVIQKRFNSNYPENFNRSWCEYKLGFGALDNEFWFGNEFIHKLTSDEDMELRVVVEDRSGRKYWAQYSLFAVDTEESNYNLDIGGYRGSFKNIFAYDNDQDFNNYHRQNDNNHNSSGVKCKNGWWSNNCTGKSNRCCIDWDNLLRSNSLISTTMMIRPKRCSGENGKVNDKYIDKYIDKIIPVDDPDCK